MFWYIVPGFRYFRFPQRMIIFAGFSLSVLAGFGIQYMTGMMFRAKSLLKDILKYAVVLVTLGLVFIESYSSFFRHRIRAQQFLDRLYKSNDLFIMICQPSF